MNFVLSLIHRNWVELCVSVLIVCDSRIFICFITCTSVMGSYFYTQVDTLFYNICSSGTDLKSLLGILNVTTKSRPSFLILMTAPKMPNLSLMPLKPSCHPQHDMRDAVLKYAIALLNR